MENYKPKSVRTLRKIANDMKTHCYYVSRSAYFGCHTCPYNVFLKDGSVGCFFEHIGQSRPADWDLNQMGTYVQ